MTLEYSCSLSPTKAHVDQVEDGKIISKVVEIDDCCNLFGRHLSSPFWLSGVTEARLQPLRYVVNSSLESAHQLSLSF